VLAPGGGSLTQSTVDATKEPGERSHAGDDGGASVWFSWTPDFGPPVRDVTIVVKTDGSDFDTLLDSFGVDGRIAANDDYTGQSKANEICFRATTGQPLLFAVDGYAGESGNLHLSWGIDPGTAPCPIQPPDLSINPGDVAAPKVGQTIFASGGTFTMGGSLAEHWSAAASTTALRSRRQTASPTPSSRRTSAGRCAWSSR
jgi:hypothetical protein